jgi:RNA polymerase sigma factor (sigma-70 family)
MATSPSRRPIPNHPLLQDRARLDAIAEVMYAQIQKVLHRYRQAIARSSAAAGQGVERALPGGESADDVLQEATLALLRFPESNVTTSWEAVAVGIAQNQAKAALRRATKGRRGSRDSRDADDRIQLVQFDGDEVDPGHGAGVGPDSLEFEFLESQQQLIILRLARELLDERERRIFFDVHYLDINRAEVGRALGGLTGQRVGQIYRQVSERLLNAAHNDPEFRRISQFTQEGGPDDAVR